MVRVNQQGKPFKIISHMFYQETHQWKLKEPGVSYIWHIFTFMKIASKQAATKNIFLQEKEVLSF